MKKLLCIALSACLILSLCPLASAATPEETEISDIVQKYLEANASAKYELKSINLVKGTISEFSEAEISKITEKALPASKSKNSDVNAVLNVDSDIGTYLNEKAEYIRYTRTQENLNITNFSTTYGKPEVSISGDTANVKIFETIGMRYDGLDEDSAISTNYSIDLIKTNDGWKIISLDSNDSFDKVRKQSFNLNEAIEQYNETVSQPNVITERTLGNSAKFDAIAKANGAKIYFYNRNNAVCYSNHYTTSTGTNTQSYYNGNFISTYPRDCTNFASQCIYAGFCGNDMAPLNRSNIPMDTHGSETWFSDGVGSTISWRKATEFRDYMGSYNLNVTSPTTPTTNNIVSTLYETGPASAGIYLYEERLPGSVILLRSPTEEGYAHAVVVGKVTGSKTSEIFVSAHTADVKLQPLSQQVDAFGNLPFTIVVPEKYYAYTNISPVRVACIWVNNVPSGSNVTFKGHAECLSGNTCWRMAIKVVAPSGAITWGTHVYNSNSLSQAFTVSEKGLYKITIYAKENSNSTVTYENTMALRTY